MLDEGAEMPKDKAKKNSGDDVAADVTTPPRSVSFTLDREVWHVLITSLILFVIGVVLYGLSRVAVMDTLHSARSLADAAQRALKNPRSPEPGKAREKATREQLEDAMLVELRRGERQAYRSEFLMHLSIAVFVAIAIVFIVEIHSRRRTAEEIRRSQKLLAERMGEYRDTIAESVFQAIYLRTLPAALVDEVEKVLRSDAVREQMHYTLRFFRYPRMDPGYVVVERKLAYTERNISLRQLTNHKIRSTVMSSTGVVDVADGGTVVRLPRHREFTVDGASVLGAATADSGSEEVQLIEHGITLGMTPVKVTIVTEEIKHIRDSNEYTIAVPTTRLSVRIENELAEMIQTPEVTMLLPPTHQFEKGEDGLLHYNRALLPGQTFLVRWEPLKRSAVLRHPAPVAAPPRAETESKGAE
jgi:hypothetical protein